MLTFGSRRVFFGRNGGQKGVRCGAARPHEQVRWTCESIERPSMARAGNPNCTNFFKEMLADRKGLLGNMLKACSSSSLTLGSAHHAGRPKLPASNFVEQGSVHLPPIRH